MHLLIPYVPLHNHLDPDFREYSYGDSGSRARKIKKDLNRSDYVFFHTTINSKKFITAYYVVDRVLDTVVACRDRAIVMKYKNPHIVEHLEGKRPLTSNDNDAVLFGDPIRSYALYPETAWNSIKLLIMRYRFKKFSCSRIKGHNGTHLYRWLELKQHV